MPARDLVLGVDSSTTSCKAVAWDARGNAVSSGRAQHPILKPRALWHEQPAVSWWQAMVQAVRAASGGIDPRRIAAICLSTQRETFTIADENGIPLSPALLWMDERAREMLPEIERIYGGEQVHQETGKPLSANLTLAKLLWMRVFQPSLFARIGRVLDVHAFLAYRLTGRFFTSWGCADPTGLFDMRRDAWHTALIQAIGLRVDQFPEALPAGKTGGLLLDEPASQLGLPAGLPVVSGIGDGQAAGLGAGVTGAGDAYLNLGTAVITGTHSDSYLVHPAFRTMYSGVPGAYALETVLPGGTYTLNWFIEKFYDPAKWNSSIPPAMLPEDQMEMAATAVPPGSQGLILVPYWNSVMNPHWDASASGIIAGWRGIHGPAHFYRAILEGIAYELRLHGLGVESARTMPIDRYIAVGGGSHSGLWRKIIADVTGKPVFRADAPEASALGAGILAASAVGLHPSVLEAARAMSRILPEAAQPDPVRHHFYSQIYEQVYRYLYLGLRDPLSRLAKLVDEQDGLPPAG